MKKNYVDSINSDYSYWHKVGAPIRPMESVIIHLKTHLRPYSNVLILGCTPEYRSLCHQLECKVTIIDKSREIYNNVTPEVTLLGTEIVIFQDWLSEVKLENSFDFILADGSFNMLSPPHSQQLAKESSRLLIKGGKLITRVHLYEPPSLKSSHEIIDYWRATGSTNLYLDTYADLSNWFQSKNGYNFDYRVWADEILFLYQSKIIPQDVFDALYLDEHQITIYLYERKKFLQWFENTLLLEHEFLPPEVKKAYLMPAFTFVKR